MNKDKLREIRDHLRESHRGLPHHNPDTWNSTLDFLYDKQVDIIVATIDALLDE